jgi:outer membrane immunogenic protein
MDIRMFRAVLLGSALGAAVACAPDAGASEPATGGQPFSWTGFYAGLSIGHAWDAGAPVHLLTDQNPTAFPFLLGGESAGPSHGTIGDLGLNGLFGGAQIGWNWRARSVVYGIEADIQGSLRDSISGIFSSPDDSPSINGVATLDLNWYATLRGRLGILVNSSLLIYATGGWAVGQVDYSLNASEPEGFGFLETRLRSSRLESGYTVGGGVETALSRNLSLKIEYQYVDLGSVGASGAVTFVGDGPTGETATLASQTVDFHTVRAGLNVHW